MPKQPIKKKIEELRQQILRHNKLYYTEGKPEISDGAYDALIRELKALEEKYPQYAAKDSPTHTVGAPIPEKFKKVPHTTPMLSLKA